MEILQFVTSDAIDPLLFESSYYLAQGFFTLGTNRNAEDVQLSNRCCNRRINAFRSREKRRYGPRHHRIERAGEVSGAIEWCVWSEQA